MREASEEVCEAAEVVCSVRMVVRYAIQELRAISGHLRLAGGCLAVSKITRTLGLAREVFE